MVAALLAFAFLTYNSLAALYRSRNDPYNFSFVLTSYADLLGLFYCLRSFEKAVDEAAKLRLKIAIWMLSTILTSMFSYKVATIMPWPAAAAVWAMAVGTVAGGFWAFFVYGRIDGRDRE